MSFKLCSFVLIYFFIIYLLYSPQKDYIHSHCQYTQTSSNQQTITCIACTDLIGSNQLQNIKSAYVNFYLPTQQQNDELNDFKMNVYQQKQCYQYQCQQLALTNSQQYSTLTKHLNEFGFQQQQLKNTQIQTNNNNKLIDCSDQWSFSFIQSAYYHQNINNKKQQKCMQYSHQLLNKRQNSTIHSLMFNLTYTLKSKSKTKTNQISNQLNNNKQIKQRQPPSFYLVYSQFGMQNALLFLLIGAIALSQSQLFFKHAFHQKYKFLGKTKNIIYLLLALSMVHYFFFYSNMVVTSLFNGYWIYLFIRVVLDSQKSHPLCSKIFSLLLSLFWIWTCLNDWQLSRSIMLGYGVMLSLMQYCFIGAIKSQLKNTILSIICLMCVIVSIYLLNKSQFVQVGKLIIMNLPFIQFMLLISSYREEKRVQKEGIFPAHGDQDIELKISRQLGY